MCDHKPSQVFRQDGAPEDGRVLLTGAGVLTDVLQTLSIAPTAGTELRLKDGASKSGRLLLRIQPGGLVSLTSMNLEFEQGLWLECDQPGPAFAAFTVAGYIADDSPDPLAIQLERIRDEITKSNQRLYDFLQGLYKGDPAT